MARSTFQQPKAKFTHIHNAIGGKPLHKLKAHTTIFQSGFTYLHKYSYVTLRLTNAVSWQNGECTVIV